MDIGINIGLAGVGLADQIALAARADRAGFSTVAALESGFDAFAMLGGAAVATTSARLMTGVATWVRPPIATVRAARTLAELSSGRFHLGLGTMPAHWNRDLYGIDPDRPVSRMREYVAVVRGALEATEPFDHRGEFFEITGYQAQPVTSGAIPIHVGATRSRMARMAAEVADGVLYNFVHTVDWIRDVLEPAVALGENGRGVRVERGVMLLCVIDNDEDRALERARHGFGRHVGIDYFHATAAHTGFDLSDVEALEQAGRHDEAVAALPDDLIRTMAAVGSAESCRNRVAALEGLVDSVQLLPPRHVAPEEVRRGYEAVLEAFGV